MPSLTPTCWQIVELAPSILGQSAPTAACACSQLFMLNWFICCARCAMSFITPPISAEMLSIASWKANPTALLAVAFNMATISSVLIKLNEPANRSMPPQPARAPGSWRLSGLTVFDGKRVHRLPPE